jgi:acyl dehydratase
VPFDPSAVGKTFGPFPFTYTWKDVALYALGCGAGVDELDLLLERRGPKVLPTFSVVVGNEALWAALQALNANLKTLVHGAQRCVQHRPLPPSGTLHTTSRVEALYDKGKGGLAVYGTRTTDAEGTLLAETEWQIFYRGEGGFGGERGPDAPAYEPPAGVEPAHTVRMPTAPTQALLYRLNGDVNPIHADPDFAAKAGFPAPILHGLCTFGHAARAAILTLCGGDPDRLASIEGRFSKPVLPGETIVTQLWPSGDGTALLRAHTAESGEPVLTLGRAVVRP